MQIVSLLGWGLRCAIFNSEFILGLQISVMEWTFPFLFLDCEIIIFRIFFLRTWLSLLFIGQLPFHWKVSIFEHTQVNERSFLSIFFFLLVDFHNLVGLFWFQIRFYWRLEMSTWLHHWNRLLGRIALPRFEHRHLWRLHGFFGNV